MAALTVLLPTISASYSVLQDGGVAEPTYVTLQPPELSSIPMSISSSYVILSELSSSGGGSSTPSQSWYFS